MKENNLAHIDHCFRELLSAVSILDMILSGYYGEPSIQNKDKIQVARDLLNKMLNESNCFVQQLIIQAEKIENMKEEFISNINHEFKTPLTTIIGTSDFLLETSENLSNEEIVPKIKRIKCSGFDLLNLVDELLNLSQLESGNYPFNLSIIDIEAIINREKNVFIDQAKQKKLKFKVRFTPNKKFNQFINDSEHLHQILSNLLNNAFKFTDKGEISLNVYCSDNRVVFSIKDTGKGIEKNQNKKIFNRFQQGNENDKNSDGKGIGLHLVKKLVDMHGGNVQLLSKLNKGSEFNIYLPLQSKLNSKINKTLNL